MKHGKKRKIYYVQEGGRGVGQLLIPKNIVRTRSQYVILRREGGEEIPPAIDVGF